MTSADLARGDAAKGRLALRRNLVAGTALALVILAAAPAEAQDGQGGNSGFLYPGGAGANTGAGGNGASGGDGGGAGGGAGAIGGSGGQGSSDSSPGAGGAAPGASGAAGTDSTISGSGGGGGAHGAVLAGLPTMAVSGGDGGAGGAGNPAPAEFSAGGGGGAGGYGAVVTGGGPFGTLLVSVAGGVGGSGGAAQSSGSGGSGGHGLVFLSPAGGAAVIAANVAGGDGGAAGGAGASPGFGGNGIVGANLALTIDAPVSGGDGFDGVSLLRAAALRFTGGDNQLTLGSGGSLDGGIDVAGTLTFVQTGDTILTGAIAGSGTVIKTGSWTLTLAGDNSRLGGQVRLEGGTIVAGDDNALGSGAFVQTAGELDVNGRQLSIGSLSGTGEIVNNGPGAASLTVTYGTTTYAGLIRDGDGPLGLSLFYGTDLTLTGDNDFSGGLLVADQAILGLGSDLAAGGAVNEIILRGTRPTIRYGDGVDNETSIFLDTDGGRLHVEAGDEATQRGIIDGRNFSEEQSSPQLLAVFDPGDGEDGENADYGFAKTGEGRLNLVGSNDYSGMTRILAGTLAIAEDGALGTGGPYNDLLLDGGTARLLALDDLDMNRLVRIGGGGGTIDTGEFYVGVPGIQFGGTLIKSGAGDLESLFFNEGSGGLIVEQGGFGIGTSSPDWTGTIDLRDGTTLYNCGCDDIDVFNPIVVDNATIDPGGMFMGLHGAITGGSLHLADSFSGGLVQLTGANSYGETHIGPFTVVMVGDVFGGVTTGSLGTGNVYFTGPSALALAVDGATTFTNTFVGAGLIGSFFDVTLTGENTPGSDFTGQLDVFGNTRINGVFGDTAANQAVVNVWSGGSIGGNGTILGSVEFFDDEDSSDPEPVVLAPGNSPGTLTIGGDLVLTPATVLNYELGQAGVPGGPNNDLVAVGGNLTLDGTLNVTPFGPGFGPGYYRIFDFGGTLTNNGLAMGSLPSGYSGSVLLNIPQQVNLLLNNGSQISQYWDGPDTTGASAAPTGDGGSGLWTAGRTNWTSPTGFAINDQWAGQLGVFAGAAGGTVTVEGIQPFQELRFETDNYLLRPAAGGGTLATTGGFSQIDVFFGRTADIGVIIQGAGGLNKIGAGTLLLSAPMTYGGPTDVAGGTLRTASNMVFAATMDVSVASGATFDIDGTLQQVDGLSGAGTVELGTGQLTVGAGGGASTFAGSIFGGGKLVKTGAGLFTLSGTSSFLELESLSGASLSIAAGGSVSVADAHNLGSLSNSGTLNAPVRNDAGAVLANAGLINGSVTNNGTLTSIGTIQGSLVNQAGTASLSNQMLGDVTVTGGSVTLGGPTTGIDALALTDPGVFQLNGFSTSVGSLEGASGGVQLGSATLTTGGSGRTTSFGGVISGAGGVTKTGTGTFTFFTPQTYTGPTAVDGGTLETGGDLIFAATMDLSVSAGATFDIASTTQQIDALTGAGIVQLGSGVLIAGAGGSGSTFAGAISGPGELRKVGAGTLTLTGSSNVGTVLVTAGSALSVGAPGSVTGAIIDNRGNLANAGTLIGPVTNSGTLISTSIIQGSLLNQAGSSSLANQMLGNVAVSGGTVSLSGATTGIDALALTAPGIFGLNGFSTSVGSLEGPSGSVQLGTATLTVGGANRSTTFGGTIAGSGGLTKTGTGTFSLSAANSYTGSTTVNGGTLAIAAGGSVAGNVFNSATFTNAGTVAAILSNSGQATNSGTIAGGVLNLAGGTFTNSGTVNFAIDNRAGGQATNNGTVAGDVLNVGTFASTATITGTLTNSGTASLRGMIGGDIDNSGTPGSILLTGDLNVAGDLFQTAPAGVNLAGFAATTRTISGGGAILLGAGTLTTGTDAASTLFSGDISGAGRLIKVGAGSLVLTGSNAIAGGTTISGGTLQIGFGGTTGSLSGPILNNSVLRINRSDALTLSQAISGSGMLVKMGSGTTTLTGANSYGGGTLVSTGRLVGNSTSLQGDIRIDATLEFAQAAAGSYAGRLTGAGTLDKTGAGLLTVTANSSSFTGGSFIRAGGLNVAGSLTGSLVTIGNGGTLFGTGTVGGFIAQSGGTVAPGNSIGTINVAGNAVFLAGSTYAAEVQPSGADLILATGQAQLAGAIQVTNLGGSYSFGSEYLLVQANSGRTGTFDTSTFLNFAAAYRPEIIYNANQVRLRLNANSLSTIAGSASLSANQASSLQRIDAAVAAGFDANPLFALYVLPAAELPGGFDALSGEIYATTTRVMLEDRLVREATLSRLVGLQRSPQTGTGVWFHAVRSWGSGDGDDFGFGFARDVQGFVGGIDHVGTLGSGTWQIGIQGHHLETDVDIDPLGSRGEVKRSGGGLHAGFTSGGFSARIGASLSSLELDVDRNIAFAGFGQSVAGDADGTMFQAFGELGYSIPLSPNATIEPFASIAVTRVNFDLVTESGTAGLVVDTPAHRLGLATAGVRGSARFGGSGGSFSLDGALGIRTAFGDRSAAPIVALAAAPGQGFAIRSQRIDGTAAIAELDARFDVTPNVRFSLGYSGVFGADARDHAARATLGIRF